MTRNSTFSDYKVSGAKNDVDVVTDFIRKYRRHIELDNCSHCRRVLKSILVLEGESEAGNHPATAPTNAATRDTQRTKSGSEVLQ